MAAMRGSRISRALVRLAAVAGILATSCVALDVLAEQAPAFAAQTAPAWNSYYFGVIQNVSFCYDISVTGAGSMLPLTGMTAGSTPSGMTNYGLENVNLTTGTAQICGKDTNAASTTHVTIAPVATNGGGYSTLSATTADYGKCTWTASGATTTVEDANQDLDLTGSQASFGSAITGGATAGSSSLYTSCTDAYVPSPGAFTTNQANPLPTPTDTNPSANQGDLASSNLELNNGCFGAVEILGSSSYSFGSATAKTLPSPWVNGGDCAYGSLGSNSAGGNTDTFATCPPTQYDVNIGYVDCSDTASSGTTSTSFNFSTDDVLFNGQPVPQQSTATLSAANATPGSTVTVTGGTNWWGSSGGAPNAGPYGDDQGGQMYQVSAPGVFIGTTRASAVPVTASTVTVSANTYSCTGAESTSVGPNPCTMTPGQPSGSFQVPSGLAAGTYNVYIDETNTTPLHGNGPNDAYQTSRGTSLGTAESATQLVVPAITLAKSTTSSGYGAARNTIPYSYLVTNTDQSTLTGVGVNDNKVANVSCPSSTLAAGASETCTGTYTVTQADVDAGSVTNTATASGTDPSSATWTSLPSSVTVLASNATSNIGLVKSTTSTGYSNAGDTIPYSYAVTNTGTTTLSGVGVSDNKIASVSCPDSTLAPGASETCTATYAVIQADVTAGSVTNIASAHATNPHSVTVTSANSSVTVSKTIASSSIGLVKSTTSTGYRAAGDTIPYSYAVTNTGNDHAFRRRRQRQQGRERQLPGLDPRSGRLRDLHRHLYGDPD